MKPRLTSLTATLGKYDLERYDVVLTTYDVLSNEHSAYQGGVEVSSKGATQNSSADSDDGFGGAVKARKDATAKPKKTKEKGSALFGVDWYRVVVGQWPHSGSLYRSFGP